MNRYQQVLSANAERRGVPAGVLDDVAEVLAEIGTRRDLTVLDDLEEVSDPHGKSFFLLPPGLTGDAARTAALMTYVVNAGTDYGAAATDFPQTPYSAVEITRIAERQCANAWSYAQDVGFVHRNGGRLVTTPAGILMGVGGNRIQRLFSARGGTVWGDIFMVNIRSANPADLLRLMVRSGHAWCADRRGRPVETTLDLDRVLHHEERHSRQWADKGHARMLADYSWELVRELIFRKTNRLEQEAGLSDGGYA